MLPKIDHPTYEVKLISRKELVKFRPFLVKEQKLLMMAKESAEIGTLVRNLKQVAKNCVLDEKLDVDTLPLVDLELLFLHFWARSVGEIQNVYYKCTNQITKEDGSTSNCGMIVEHAVNLLEIPIENELASGKIELTPKIGIQMKLPSFDAIEGLDKIPEEDRDFYLASKCIDYIWDESSVHHSTEATAEEMLNFVENLSSDKYQKIEEFFESSPKIRLQIMKVCPKCGYQHDIELEGLEDFFL